MIELTFAQKESIGFQYVLEALRPCSAYGQELLRNVAPLGPDQKSELLRQFSNIQKILDNSSACQKELDGLLRIMMTMKLVRAEVLKCRETALNEIELFEMKRFLLQSSEIYPYWCRIQPILQLDGIEILDTSDALDILDPERNRVAAFFIGDGWSPVLQAVRQEKRRLEELLRQTTDDTQRESLLTRRSDIAAREEQEEARIREALSLALRPHISAIVQNMAAIADLDLTAEKARLARRWGGTMPVITENRLDMEAMANPRIRDLLQERNQIFTPISMSLQPGAAVITGANMGGKSVALKTLALNVLLIQCGFFPFAKKASAPLFDSIHILSEDSENVDRGLSSFGGEIVRFNRTIQQLQAGFPLILLDEFARGTNPDEGAAIVQAVTEYLNGQNAITVLATHYDNVAPFANAHYQVIGLKALDPDKLRRELSMLDADAGVRRISQYMNYGLYRVEGEQDCPKDALNICRLLGMDCRILRMVEKNYGAP